jgi:hypothetical protein
MKGQSTMKQQYNRFDGYRVHKGYLVGSGPTRDGAFRTRDEEEDDDDVIEVHNIIPDFGAQTFGTDTFSDDPDTGDRRPRSRGRSRNRDDEGQAGQEVTRLSADEYRVVTEGDEIVIYRIGNGSNDGDGPSGLSQAPETDIYDFDTSDRRARDSRSRSHPPRTLADLNRFHAAHYKQKAGRR